MSTVAQQKVQAIINENPVGMQLTFIPSFHISPCPFSHSMFANRGVIGIVIFSKSYCPYCRASKETLTEAGATFFVVELDKVG